MIDEAIILREPTLHDLSSLVQHGVLPGSRLEGFGGTAAYRKVARDVIGLSNSVDERWADIQGNSMISLEKMDQASALGRTIEWVRCGSSARQDPWEARGRTLLRPADFSPTTAHRMASRGSVSLEPYPRTA